jgi:hypothetical protein
MTAKMTTEPYGVGIECTWHGPLTFASDVSCSSDDQPLHACPYCGGSLKVTDSATFWSGVSAAEQQRPGYDQMMCWSQGQCFPDYDTLENAWRQAMEGQ